METQVGPPIDLPRWQELFLKKLQGQGRSLNTLKNYRTDLQCFNKYLEKKQGNIQLGQFNIPQAQQYGAFLQEKYHSDNSRRRRVQALRIFFDFLVEQNIFSHNPVKKLSPSPKFLDIPRPTPFGEIKTFWGFLIEEGHSSNKMVRLLGKRNQVIFLLIYGAGLKVSNLANLQTKHIILEDRPRVFITPRRRDPYTLALPEIFTPLYQDYLTSLKEAQNKMKRPFDEVFFNANPYCIISGGLSPRGLEAVFEEYRKRPGLSILTPKSLRQACIFKWITMGVSETLIKEWMGVAPSYSMKLYREHSPRHIYDENFLTQMYRHGPVQ